MLDLGDAGSAGYQRMQSAAVQAPPGSGGGLTVSVGPLILPLAHAGHILIDGAIFGVPVGSVLLTIFALNRWGPRDQ